MSELTVRLLELLVSYGFTDEDIHQIHHRRELVSIEIHRNYSSGVKTFHQDNTNARVFERLEIVLGAYLGGRFARPAAPGVFAALCRAALTQVPFDA